MTNTVKAITPAEAQAAKEAMIPDFVIEAVNNLLRQQWLGQNSLTLLQDEVITEIQKTQDITREEIFNSNFLDFENHFRKAGWKVIYDKPPYYADTNANWEFSV